MADERFAADQALGHSPQASMARAGEQEAKSESTIVPPEPVFQGHEDPIRRPSTSEPYCGIANKGPHQKPERAIETYRMRTGANCVRQST